MKFRTIYAYLWLDIVRPYLLPVTKMDLIFYQKISKSVIIFLLEIEGFWGGQTWAVGKPYHPANGLSKNIWGY